MMIVFVLVVLNKLILLWVLDRKLMLLSGFECFFDFMVGDLVIVRWVEFIIEDEWVDLYIVFLFELVRIVGGGIVI